MMGDRPQETWLATAGRWLRGTEFSLLLTLVLIMGGIWVFVVMGNAVAGADPHGLDQQILLALRDAGDPDDPLGPGWVEVAVRDFTALGGTAVLVFLSAAVIGYFLLRREWHLALLVVVTFAGGALLTQGLKVAYDRPRPELVPALTYVLAPSFPSGHSSAAAATYLTLASLLARVQKDRRVKVYSLTLAVVLTLLVGLSRVYLGVHWPSDVVGGWLLGAVWAMATLLASRWWRRRVQA